MAEYSRIAKGSFTSTGVTKAIYLPFVPQTVEVWNWTNANAGAAASKMVSAYWDVQMGQGFGLMTNVYNSSSVMVADTVAANGITTFSAGLQFQFGARKQIIGATAANPIVFNVTAHGYSVGDIVLFEGLYQSATTGMPQICGMPFVISAVGDANHFSVVWPGAGSNYTALSGSPTGAYVKKVLYPFLYEPGTNFIEAITTGATTTVTTTAPHNFVVGQEIAFRIPSLWGTVELNALPNTTLPGSPVYYYVTSVSSNTQFVCNAVSTGFTAFNTNQTVANTPGLSFPQVCAVGDVNSGGVAYSGGSLFPSQSFPTSSGGTATINGPAIQGSYITNTSSGFYLGTGGGTTVTAATIVGANSDVIYWRATAYDLLNP